MHQDPTKHASSESSPKNTEDRSPSTQNVTNLSPLSQETFPEREDQQQKPIASCHELCEISHWDELRNLYSTKGYAGSSDEDLLTLAKKDWSLIKETLREQALANDLPIEFPYRSIQIGEKKISIFGIVHSLAMHPDVMVLLAKSLAKHPILLAEQGLGQVVLPLYSHGLDLPDHFARGVINSVVNFELRQLQGIKFWIKKKLNASRIASGLREFKNRGFGNYTSTSNPEAKAFETFQRQHNHQDESMKIFSRMALSLPGDFIQEIPANIELARKHHLRIPYSDIEARSAYMAEFIRYWDPVITLANHSSKNEGETLTDIVNNISIVCGQAHQPEIEFFLRNGSQEQKVIDLARKHAQVLEQKGVDGLVSIHQRNQALFWTLETPFSIAKGAGFYFLLKGIANLLS